ncbi:MAG TPA: M23 family metallopeptidase [Cyclobacteriaceae bacterium]|nr:M23 family metallopeptidase [Cyclobacteriaceae bacterium]
MPESKYIYNPKTLRFERSRISILQIVMTLFGLLSFGAFFFIGLVVLQNYVIETPVEKYFRAENRALKDYKVQLVLESLSAENQMSQLEQKDKSLYEKIFETKKSEGKTAQGTQADKAILLADASAFHELTDALLSKSKDLYIAATGRSNHFGETAMEHKKDKSRMVSVPSFPPIADFDATKLVSGYGMRINPFHKGKYHHDGVDLAAPRGSEVLAAGPGTIIAIVYSDLQAGFGNYVDIDHGSGYVTHYANLGDITARYGQRIAKGQPIGRIGISGGSVAPHVHYEVLKDGKNLDPLKFLMHGLSADQYNFILEAGQKQNQSLD